MHVLIAAQVAFCFVVLFASGLFTSSFERLSHRPLGFSADRLEQRREEGHLGLTLLTGLVAEAGGRLVVDSTPGRGTRLEAEVPVT